MSKHTKNRFQKVVSIKPEHIPMLEEMFERGGGEQGYTTYGSIVGQALEHFKRTAPGLNVVIPFGRGGSE